MTLRKKTLLIMGITLLGLIALLYIAISAIVNASFSQMETESVLTNAQRAVNTLEGDLAEMAKTAEDYGAWDDTVNFIEGNDDEYPINNLTNDAIMNLQLNAVLYLDTADQVFYTKSVDLDSGEEVPTPDSLKALAQQGVFANDADPFNPKHGVLLVPEGPMLFAAQCIITSLNELPIRGTLVQIRYITPEVLDHWSEKMQLPISIQRVDDPNLAPSLMAEFSALPEQNPYLVKTTDPDIAWGHALVKDTNGEPAFIMKVEVPRLIHAQGQTTLRYLLLALLALGAVALAINVFILEREVLGRISRLTESIVRIGTTGKPTGQIPVEGNDELSRVGKAINEMLSELDHSRQEIIQARDELEDTNLALKSEIAERQRVQEEIEVSLEEKALLLQEIHHRVKNNLQIVSSLLYLQSLEVESPDAFAILKASESRIRSMALVHERLYQSEGLARIDFQDYTQTLIDNLASSYNAAERHIDLTADAEKVSLPIDLAIPCGLIINELVSNALKHGFPDGQEGQVDVRLHETVDRMITLSVANNGVSLPDDFDIQHSSSLGLQLVRALVKQLKGTLTLQRDAQTEFTVRFPHIEKASKRMPSEEEAE